jgi:hypothetical protein
VTSPCTLDPLFGVEWFKKFVKTGMWLHPASAICISYSPSKKRLQCKFAFSVAPSKRQAGVNSRCLLQPEAAEADGEVLADAPIYDANALAAFNVRDRYVIKR